MGFSRDGFHWHRPDRRAFNPVSETRGDWNWGNVQSAGGGCLIVGDRLYFYVSARKGISGSRSSGVCTTGLATLRRDGFASLDAADTAGTVTTRCVRFQGRYLFVNADVDGGELRAEVIDVDGKPIAPFTRDKCVAVREESTLTQVSWSDTDDLSTLRGRTVRLRFYLPNGSLYSFWVTPDRSGRATATSPPAVPDSTAPSTPPVGNRSLDAPTACGVKRTDTTP